MASVASVVQDRRVSVEMTRTAHLTLKTRTRSPHPESASDNVIASCHKVITSSLGATLLGAIHWVPQRHPRFSGPASKLEGRKAEAYEKGQDSART